MTEMQMKLFQMLYKFVHDEGQQCANLVGMIDLEFPDPEQGELAHAMHHGIRPYLVARGSIGANAMELLYMLKANLDADLINKSAGGRSDG